MRILHIEDDDTLRRWVKIGLTQSSFTVDGARDAREGMRLAGENTYDIILLDIGMPELNGYWALQTLRQGGHTAAIFIISGQSGEEDKLLAFQAGADDYMTKPIFISELVARIRRWLQRRDKDVSSKTAGTILTVGALTLDLLKRRASIGGRLVLVTPREYSLLEYLMRHAGKVVTQVQLAQAAWNIDFDTASNVVEVHITRLRKKIDKPGKASFIETIRGSGYMIDGEVLNTLP